MIKADLRDPEYTQGASATIGVQRDGRFGQQYAYREPVLRPEMALVAYQAEADSDFRNHDVGAVGLAGDSIYDPASNRYTVMGSGRNIGGRRDAFHYVYRTLQGDGEMVAQVNLIECGSPWAKAGVMMRARLKPSASNALITLTADRGAIFQSRRTEGRTTKMQRHRRSATWVKLVRKGNRFKGYRSVDGKRWRWVGARSIDMPQQIYMGMAVTARGNDRLCTAEFSDVRQ